MRVEVVSRPELAAGFALAGIEATRVCDSAAATEIVGRLAVDPAVAIVLVDQVLYDGVPRDVRERWDRHGTALIVPVPPPAWDRPGDADAYILDILRQAIGYRVRPR